MSDEIDPAPPPAPATFEDVPLLVRVELTTLTLSASACAALATGDVVQTGVRIGQPVSLRTGGVVVARGELCDLEGMVVVRILETQQGEAP